MKKIWFATKNKGKIKEIKEILSEFEIRSIDDLETNLEIEEDGVSFKQNALIKAKALQDYIDDEICIGDDSGLCVQGLKGFPGIYSARWAGEDISDYDRSQKLLDMMQEKNLNKCRKRKAYLITTLALYNIRTQKVKFFSGKLKGKISFQVFEGDGFGYDNIFIPNKESKTLTVLGQEYKNKYSHRFIALKKLKKYLEKNEKN